MALTRARATGGGTASKRRFDFAGTVRPRSSAAPSAGYARAFQFKWANAVSEEEWAIYVRAIEALRAAGVPFMLGGGFALAAFTGRWRDTKDIDFYILPENRDKAVTALTEAGFEDYFSNLSYDRKWIYRSTRSGVIVDMIWSMANQRAQVDDQWFERAGTIELRGQRFLILPPEEFMWCKLYILQRDHCDWTDVFNLLYAVGDKLDWEHLIERVEEDTALLQALLLVYGWLCPEDVLKLPRRLWRLLRIPAPPSRPKNSKRNHIRLLDSRGWFAALQPIEKKMEI